MVKLLLVITCFFISVSAGAQSFIFAQLTGAPVNTTGWNLTGNAYVGNTAGGGGGNSEVILTNAFTSQSGGIFYSQPINIVQCDKWTVEFDFRIWEGDGADGIAFCLLDVPPSGFVGGGGVGIPGASNGLKIVFDTYNNCGAANPALQIRWGAGYGGGECDYSQPTLDNSGQLNFIRSNNYNQARIEYDAGNIQVYVNNTLYISGYYVINFTTYAGFTAATGGATDKHSIRNVTIRTEMAQPDAYAGPNAATCANQPLQIGSPSTPNYQYSWTPTTGLNNANIANPTLTLPNPGPNPVTVMYKVGANIVGSPMCVRYDSVYVTVYPLPIASFAANQGQFCVGQTATITYTGTASSGANYTWNFDGGTVISGSGQGPYQVQWPTAGIKNPSLTVVENNCTSQPVTIQIPVYDYPTSAFTITQPGVCINAPANITYTGTAGVNAQYTWNFDGGTVGTGAGQGPYTVSWPTAGTPTVSLTVTENGCTSTQTQNSLTVYPIPTATFQLPTQVCIGLPATELYTGTGTVNGQYTWGFDGGTATPLAGNQNNDITWTTAGIKQVSLTVVENGCTSPTVTNAITVYDLPTADFTLTPSVCAAAIAQIDYTGTGTGAGTYTWGFNGGVATPTGNEDYDISWATDGSYTVTLSVVENGCTSTPIQQTITVNPIPTATFTGQTPLCDGQAAAIAYTGSGTPAATYNWNFAGGTPTQVVGESYTVLWPGAGSYNVSLTVTENGCPSVPYSQQVVIYPIPDATFSATPTVCLLDAAQVAITAPYSPGAVYTWTWNGGNPVAGGAETYDVTWAQPGTYTVGLTVSENGCTSSPQSQQVTVNYQPTATFTMDAFVCVNEDLNITYTGNGLPGATYTWNITGTTNITGSGQGPVTANWTTDGLQSVTLTVTENGCTATEKQDVTVAPLPQTFMLPSYGLCIGQELVLDPGSFSSYIWSNGVTDRKMNVGLTGVYSVTVTDGTGCVNTFTTQVDDSDCFSLFIPNAFTPNGDNKNEVFKPVVENPITYTIRIYNRWGELLFVSANDADAYWDGTHGGTRCQPDVYIYYIEYSGLDNNKKVLGTKKGTVALID